jgi:hypothetical protein
MTDPPFAAGRKAIATVCEEANQPCNPGEPRARDKHGSLSATVLHNAGGPPVLLALLEPA